MASPCIQVGVVLAGYVRVNFSGRIRETYTLGVQWIVEPVWELNVELFAEFTKTAKN